MKVCVVGVGKPWAGDDGVGPAVVGRLADRFEGMPPVQGVDLTFSTSPEPAVDLLRLMDGCDILIIIDAVRSGAPPGTIHRQAWLPGLLQPRGLGRASSHGLGVHEMLALAGALNRLPRQVFLWGIEIVSTEPGQGLSPQVTAALDDIVESISQTLAVYTDAILERGER